MNFYVGFYARRPSVRRQRFRHGQAFKVVYRLGVTLSFRYSHSVFFQRLDQVEGATLDIRPSYYPIARRWEGPLTFQGRCHVMYFQFLFHSVRRIYHGGAGDGRRDHVLPPFPSNGSLCQFLSFLCLPARTGLSTRLPVDFVRASFVQGARFDFRSPSLLRLGWALAIVFLFRPLWGLFFFNYDAVLVSVSGWGFILRLLSLLSFVVGAVGLRKAAKLGEGGGTFFTFCFLRAPRGTYVGMLAGRGRRARRCLLRVLSRRFYNFLCVFFRHAK